MKITPSNSSKTATVVVVGSLPSNAYVYMLQNSEGNYFFYFKDLDQNLPLSNSDAYNLLFSLGTLLMMRMEWYRQVIYFLRLAIIKLKFDDMLFTKMVNSYYIFIPIFFSFSHSQDNQLYFYFYGWRTQQITKKRRGLWFGMMMMIICQFICWLEF